MYQERYYQLEAEQSIYNYFSSKTGNPVIAMPTGTGKSWVIANFMRNVLRQWPRQRFIVATHVKELIKQNYDKLIEAWPEAPAGIHSAGLKQRDVVLPIIFGGIQSMVNRVAEFGWRDILIVDECHLISGKETSKYGRFITGLRRINPNLKVIGLSATPYRMGQGLITEAGLFTDVCYDLCNMTAFNRLISEGFLCPLIPKRTKTELNYEDVSIQNGDYVQKDLQHAVDKDAITYAACKEIIEQGYDRRSLLLFASGIEHSDHIASCMQSFGVSSYSVHSKISDKERKDVLKAFKAYELRCVVNNNVLTTGFDHPGIDLIGVLRPTVSTVLWVQMLGRGTRPGKTNCLVLDFAGNTKRLGPINDPVIPKKKGSKDEPGVAPIRICEACGTYNHARATQCCFCGAKLESAPKITRQASSEELIRTSDPLVQIFDVNHVTYHSHNKAGAPPILKVCYMVANGLQLITEYICFEHKGMARKKACDWWRMRMYSDPPYTVADALSQASYFREPKRIRVWTNKAYPEILGAEF
jgi:DNA repair protein RadD